MARKQTNLHSAILDAQGQWNSDLQQQRSTNWQAWMSGNAPSGQAWVHGYRTGNHHIIEAPLGMANRPANAYAIAYGKTDRRVQKSQSIMDLVRVYAKTAITGQGR